MRRPVSWRTDFGRDPRLHIMKEVSLQPEPPSAVAASIPLPRLVRPASGPGPRQDRLGGTPQCRLHKVEELQRVRQLRVAPPLWLRTF
jgi:hypothetical protein